jgi:hypothetical protein
MNEQGINHNDRYYAINSRDYNGMAGDLAKRQTVSGIVQTAYEKAYLGNISGFETYKADYTQVITAATATGVSINGANQYYVPQATSTDPSGGTANKDNRYQNLAITVTSGAVKIGDAFTVAGVNAVHHITKEDTGSLKTCRITGIISGNGGTGVVQISPPFISTGDGSTACLQYQNVTATPANGAVITFLNTVTAKVNPFWQKDALEILPGHFTIPENAGVAIMRGTTSSGIELALQKWYVGAQMVINYRVDTFFGVCNKQPEMTGIQLFNQA